MSNKLIVHAENLSKTYGGTEALSGIDMKVGEGIVYGLLGQNGAGKTTTLRIIMSLLRPTGGKIEVLGHNPEIMPLSVRQQIGYSSDSMQLIPWLKVAEILNYNGTFYDNWDKEYVRQWVERLELPLNKRVFQLSRGNRQKLALIMAIGHRPKLLVLDEPAGGLDPLARKEFLESIIELIHQSGTSIIISSHLLSDLERISDYIGIINQGKMKLEMPLENLKSSVRKVKVVSETVRNNSSLGNLIDLDFKQFNNSVTGISTNWNENKLYRLRQDFPEALIEIEPLNLEEIFLAYTSK